LVSIGLDFTLSDILGHLVPLVLIPFLFIILYIITVQKKFVQRAIF
jgi:hypothetical protein